MKKVLPILILFSQIVFAREFDLSQNYRPGIRLKPFVTGKLKLGKIDGADCDCGESTEVAGQPIAIDHESLGAGRALREFYRKPIDKSKGRNVTVEVITPAFKQGKTPQLRSRLTPINLTPIASNLRKPLGAYSEEELSKIIVAHNPKASAESAIDYSTRIHAAVTALQASRIGEDKPKEALKYIQARSKGKSFRYKIHFSLSDP